MLGVDYVLDFLRATISAQDPYILFLLFLSLKSRPNVRLLRVKNKFFDDDEPRYIRTNILVNFELQYPTDAAAFAASNLRGTFDTLFVGRSLAAVEVQLTLRDFLAIKHLSHTYYEITRSETTGSTPEAFILEHPFFVDADTLDLEAAAIPGLPPRPRRCEKTTRSGPGRLSRAE